MSESEPDMSEFWTPLNSGLAIYDSAQFDFELYLDTDELSVEIETSTDYRNRIRVPRIDATKLFASLIQNDDKQSVYTASNISGFYVDVSWICLVFGDDVREGTSFWELF